MALLYPWVQLECKNREADYTAPETKGDNLACLVEDARLTYLKNSTHTKEYIYIWN